VCGIILIKFLAEDFPDYENDSDIFADLILATSLT